MSKRTNLTKQSWKYRGELGIGKAFLVVAACTLLIIASIFVTRWRSRVDPELLVNAEFNNLVHNLQVVLYHEGLCGEALLNSRPKRGPASFSPDARLYPDDHLARVALGDKVLAEVGKDHGRFTITALELTEVDARARKSTSATTSYLTNLRIEAKRNELTVGAGRLQQDFLMVVTTDTDGGLNRTPDHTIIQCHGGAMTAASRVAPTPVVTSSVEVLGLLDYYNGAVAECPSGFAITGLWDNHNTRFNDLDQIKCQSFDQDLEPKLCNDVTANAGRGDLRPAASDTWETECDGQRVMVGIGDEGTYSAIQFIRCCELRSENKELIPDRRDCYSIAEQAGEPTIDVLGGGPSNALAKWKVQCDSGYVAVGLWDDLASNFEDLDDVKCCRYTIEDY